MLTAHTLYPITNYSFGRRTDTKEEKDRNIDLRMQRLKSNFDRDGMRRSVEGILLVHEHNHPHILLLQLTQTFFRLPGGRLRPGEDEAEGLTRKLKRCLTPTAETLSIHWDVGECAGVFWRPNFDTLFYPYCPTHIARPKECKKLFLVPMPSKCVLAVPSNMRLVAVPLFELYDNFARYGPLLSSLPNLLSRLRVVCAGSLPVPKSVPPAKPPPGAPPAAILPAPALAPALSTDPTSAVQASVTAPPIPPASLSAGIPAAQHAGREAMDVKEEGQT